ncbi:MULTISPECIES: GspE/PulE family protein [unclassified Butyrivibrio]|uniref:GspE/PulE family protein n=1 Tax=unclassified Butyrivibrio TaxID=2639466 RepID=UPI0003B3FBA8|nr:MULTISPECIES: GspE/PulE family protein [unclassified Butyrivibrio]SEK92431.1 type IV pilus assembly protein PilB [Butyrivibrio sp. ob235]
MPKKRIGDLLIERGLINDKELQFALDMQKQTHEKLGEVLINNRIVSPEDMAKTLAVQLEVDYIDLAKVNIPQELTKLVQKNTAKQNHLVPVRQQGDSLLVAMDDPLNFYALDEVRKASNLKIVPLIATNVAVERAINTLYGNENAKQAIADYKKELGLNESEKAADTSLSNFDFVITSNTISGDGDSAPTIRLVNSIIERAVSEHASDIHFEPREQDMDVRMRIDGVLRDILKVPKDITAAVIARIKTMSGMDVAEKRIPQDGRFAVSVLGKSIDMRVSTLPIAWGEKIVCRLLDKSNTEIDKEMLGLRADDMEKYEKLIHYKNGVMLLVGPTGSGKTTTMYAMLNELNTRDVNLVTLEDPIEYNLDGLNQVQVNTKTNMTFANGLRAILRQDPDIVSVGEIRDGETAEICLRAALTGRFVMSTIHTNDAIGAIDRLEDIGVEPYLISATLRGVISQRLVRRVCPYCAEEYEPQQDEIDKLGIKIQPGTKFKFGRGCQHCFNTGYSGRIAIFEIMMVTPEIRDLIYKKAGRSAIEQELKKEGSDFVSLKEAGIKLVLEGVTTAYEVMRVTNESD